jgi:hypothetical protein
MLSLLDPVELEDTVILRDDVQPEKFYPLPDQPVIPVDEEGDPEFLFIKYIKDVNTLGESERDVGGGLLQFRTVLGIHPDRRQKIVDALRARLEQEKAAGTKPFGHAIESTEPLLAAPLWTSGKVTMSTFKVSDTGLVRNAAESAAVDLAGDLGASISLELDDTGAEIFWSAFKSPEGQIPIMITYHLTYKARVSAKMTIEAQREIVHRRIIEQARPWKLVQAPYVRYVPLAHAGPFALAQIPALALQHAAHIAAMVPRQEIREIIQRTIVNNEITVRIETDEAGQTSSEVRDSLFKLATEILSDRVVPALFGEDSARPGASTAEKDNADVDLVQVGEAATGSADLNFNMQFDHQSTIERSVSPNGPIELLITNKAALQNSFKELRLTDGFFSLMKVTASTSGVNFKDDGIDVVHVFFDYEEQDDLHPEKVWVRRQHDALLKSEQEVIHWRFDTARNARGGHKRNYRYRTEVFYTDGPPSKSAWTPSSVEKLLITPHAMGAIRVEAALTAPESVVSSARVLLKHQAGSGATYETALELTPKADRRTWFQYTGELAATGPDVNPEYTCQIIYRAGGGEIVMPPVRTSAKSLEIPSPFKKVLTFHLRPQGAFEGVRDVSGDATYKDSDHQYQFTRPFVFDKVTATVPVEVPVLEGGPEVLHWKARQNRADGSSVDLGSGQSGPGTVWVGKEMQVMRIQVLPDLINFDTDVQLAVVRLSYVDEANQISLEKTLTFSKTAKAPQVWELGRAPGGHNKYDADIRYFAYDRAKSSEVHERQVDQEVYVLDRARA